MPGRQFLPGVAVKIFKISAGHGFGMMPLHIAIHPGDGIFSENAHGRQDDQKSVVREFPSSFRIPRPPATDVTVIWRRGDMR